MVPPPIDTLAVPTKKRTRKSQKPAVDPEEKEVPEQQSDEEPVTKRGRKNKSKAASPKREKAPASPKAKAAANPKSPKKAIKIEEVEETENTAKPDESESEKLEKPKKSVKAEETGKAEYMETEETVKAMKTAKADTPRKPKADPRSPKRKKSPAKKEKAKETAQSDVESAASEVDEKEIDGASDVEKPAINIKARKEIQSKLTSSAKGMNPYPDWKAGKPVPYAALAKTFTLIEATTKRLEKISHTSLFLRQVLRLTPDELLVVIHLMINKLAADYEGVELGIGESLIMKAICESCGRTLAKVKDDQKEIGDLGEVALKSRNTQQTLFTPKPLTIKDVHAALKEIATTKGDGGQGRKVAGIKKMLSAAKGDEAKYLVRGLEGKLRLGLAERSVIVALSQAVIVHEAGKEGKKAPSLEQMAAAEAVLKEVYSELPNYEIIIPEMMKAGIMSLKDTCKLQPGVPLKPMLAKPTKSISEVLDRFEGKRFTCEYKYDGERVQIHYVAPNSSIEFPTIDTKAGIAKIFSRNSEELSPKYPDILAALDKWVKPGVESFVLDCEAVAWDREEKRVLPFQQLMTRKRKDVAIEDVKIKVCVFGFDLLFLNGKVIPPLHTSASPQLTPSQSLVQETLSARRDLMHSSFSEILGEFSFATATDGQELDTIQTFLEESIKASCEGLMVKMLDTTESYYEPSKRSRNWLKVKKDYLAGAGDSLDLVVIGAYHGRGKRAAVYGSFLLACYNPASQNFETICNIGTGFSEEMLQKLHTELVGFEIDRPKPYYLHASGNMQQPDVWFEPKLVWEVKTADLSLSPKYMAAKGLADTDGRGVSLRFPRFIRERDDKKPEDATSAEQVAEMYRKQDVVMNNAKKGTGTGVDDDFEY